MVGILGVAAIFLVAVTLHWPLLKDAQVIHYINFLMDHGFAPYRNITDMNMPGAYLIEGWGMHVFGGGDVAWRVYDFALMGSLCAGMVVIARPYDWVAGLFAGVMFALVHTMDGPGNTGERDEVMAVLIVVGYAFLFEALRRKKPWLMALFGLSLGMAGAVKPTVAPLEIALLVMAWWTLRKRGEATAAYVWSGIAGVSIAVAIFFGFLFRYHALSALIDGRNFEGIREHLHGIGDIERILARVALRSARPRDLTQLRRSLALLPALRAGLEPIDSPLLQELRARVEEHDDVVKLLTAAIAEEPSTFVRDGGVIAEGYDADLDELRRIATHTDEFLLELERRERERTGIAGLKLGYNRVSGFFIEITRKDAERVPKDYIRRQTVKSAERFITEELKGFEEKVLSARDRSLAREKDLYETILTQLIDRLGPMQASGMALSELDALASLAERACTLEWSRPDLVSESRISIECGRHPIVQRFSTSPFVPNDLRFDSGRNMLIITGPNMGGKSTYMRQAALIVLLAHIGSHVPADRATIGPLDRIFTRIGAADDLAGGRSTFMVEMTEAANILHNATARSLILMDEIGRGTSTFDGLSLAWAMAHHIATRLKSFTLFATHYFELTTLATEVEGCVNVHLDATEHGDGIVFLHAVKEGPANRSYGLQVAQLAGVPREVITQARHYLEALESQRDQHDAAAADRHSTQRDLFAAAAPARAPKSPAPADPLRTAMEAIDPDELSPKAALETLYRLRKLLKSGD